MPAADVAARERLLVAGLLYLVTPIDLVPDGQPGGYFDDVVLLAWVFGAAPHLADDADGGDAGRPQLPDDRPNRARAGAQDSERHGAEGGADQRVERTAPEENA